MDSQRFKVLAVLLLGAGAVHAAPQASDLVKATLLADTSAIQPGRPFNVGVLLKLAPKWHVYWINAGDAGIPTTVQWHLPPGFTASTVQYPAPLRLEQAGGIVIYGYSDEVMLLATITPPQKIDTNNVTIAADANWLVCADNCIPGDARLSIDLPVRDKAQAAHSEVFNAWQKRMPVAASQVDQIRDCVASVSLQTSEISVVIDWKGTPPSQIEWFPPARDEIQFGKRRIETKGTTTAITVPFERFGSQKFREMATEAVVAFKTAEGSLGVIVPVKVPAAP
jgi:DsbC/DsbD-like thiol-disulfide interchange protein